MPKEYHRRVWYDYRVSEENKITGWSFLKAVLLKPTWEFLTVGVFFTALFVTTWWRDNFASDAWKRRLDLNGFLPHWHPAWWVCIGLVVLILVVVRASYRLWRIEHERLVELEEAPIPELVITLVDNNLGEALGILLKNVSHTDNLHNATIEDSKTVFGKIAWFPYLIPYIQSNGGYVQVEPIWEPELNGQKVFLHSLKRVCDALRQLDKTDGVHKIELRVMAHDARKILYIYSAVLNCHISLNYWSIGPTRSERTQRITDKKTLRRLQTWALQEGKSNQPDNDSPDAQ